MLVPVTLAFESKKTAGRPYVIEAEPDIPRVLGSPVFSNFGFT
jgi:chitinase